MTLAVRLPAALRLVRRLLGRTLLSRAAAIGEPMLAELYAPRELRLYHVAHITPSQTVLFVLRAERFPQLTNRSALVTEP
jgi:hypothetical protein